MTGRVVSIHIAPKASAPTVSVPRVRAVAGRGLEGDRYFRGAGTYSEPAGSDRELTFIELEAIEAFREEYASDIAPGDARRNIVTEGVSLNDLVGVGFRVGRVLVRGVRLCEPCRHLAGLTDANVLPGLVHRGGLRAQILEGGIVRVGDPIAVEED